MSQHSPIIESLEGVSPKLADDVFVAPGAAVIADVTIGAGSSVWYGCVLRGDDQPIRIGERSNIQDGTIIHVSRHGGPVEIGNDVVVGHAAKLHSCVLEDGCLVGIGAVVLDRARVEAGAIVAAGAVVAPGKTVPSGEMWGGMPARKLRDVQDRDREYMKTAAAHYVAAAKAYKAERG